MINNDIPSIICFTNEEHQQQELDPEGGDKMKDYLIQSMCRTISATRCGGTDSKRSSQAADRIIDLSRTIMEIIDEDDYYKSMTTSKTDEIILDYLLPIYKTPNILNDEKYKLDIMLFLFWWRKLIFNRITDNTIWKRRVVLKQSPNDTIKSTANDEEDKKNEDIKNSLFEQYQKYHQLDDDVRGCEKKTKKDVNVTSCLSSLSPMRYYFETFCV